MQHLKIDSTLHRVSLVPNPNTNFFQYHFQCVTLKMISCQMRFENETNTSVRISSYIFQLQLRLLITPFACPLAKSSPSCLLNWASKPFSGSYSYCLLNWASIFQEAISYCLLNWASIFQGAISYCLLNWASIFQGAIATVC